MSKLSNDLNAFDKTGSAGNEASAKERIEACALEMFAIRGFEGASVREIVESAGVTKPTLYYHFGNKDGLFDALFHNLREEFMGEFDAICLQKKGLKERLLDLVCLFLRWMRERPLLARFVYRVHLEEPLHDPGRKRIRHPWYIGNAVESLFERAVADGDLVSDFSSGFLANQFVGGIQIYLLKQAVGEPFAMEDDLAERIVTFFWRSAQCGGE